MEITIKEPVEVTFKHSANLDALNDAIKEEVCSDNLSDVGLIKIEEHDIEEVVPGRFKIEKEEQNNESSLESDGVYDCYNCDFKCFEKSSLIVHMQTHNKKPTNRITSKSACHSKFPPKGNLKKQEAVQVTTFKYSHDLAALNEANKEQLCSDSLSDVESIKIEEHDIEEVVPGSFKIEKEEQNHEISLESDRVYYCYNCDFKCSEKSSLIVHVQTHNKKATNSITCKNACHYKFLSKSNLKKRDMKLRFTCSVCDYECSQKSNLKSHSLVHTGDKSFKCTVCDYKCSRKSNLKSHLLVHTGDKPFKCSVCDYKCSHKGALNLHLMVHTGEKPFKCTVCDYRCLQKNHLKIHSLVHTGDKSFKCTVCDYKCSRKSSLKSHLLVHTGEKPFKCSVCDYECSQKSNLKKHLLVHTGEKPFKCSVCDYKCSQKKSLKRHLMVHTGEKPFKCSICDYKCSLKSYLKSHLLVRISRKTF